MHIINQLEFVVTKDNSHTLYRKDMREPYHSIHGAMQESRYVFIQEGFYKKKENPLHIFEMGLGTGLNAFLTLQEALKTNRMVYYYSIEKHPLPQSIIDNLNYSDEESFQHIHTAKWNSLVKLNPYFYLQKIEGDVVDIAFKNQFDLIYFDAFAPNKQSELWTEQIFEKMKSFLKPNGLLTTYCAKGEVKRTMQAAGLTVEKRPGPPGKREMIHAWNYE